MGRVRSLRSGIGLVVIRSALFYVVMVLATAFFSTVAVVGGLFRARKGLYDWVHRNWSRSLLASAGARLSADGLEHVEPDRAQIFVSNHQSGLDIWALMATLPASLRFVAKQELGRIPVFAAACRAAGHVFIDRHNPGDAVPKIRAAGDRMRDEGLSLVMFPEGTRSRDGSLGRFKKGAFALAIETGADIVPVAVDGGGRILTRGSRRVRAGPMTVRCGPRISLADATPEDRDRILEETRGRIGAMLEVRVTGSSPSG